MRRLWESWQRTRTQAPSRVAVALSLAVVLALAVYVGCMLVAGDQAGPGLNR